MTAHDQARGGGHTKGPDDGGAAFPVLHSIDGNWVREPLEKYTGMSLRDWFAGQALAGLLSTGPNKATCGAFARDAYALADAMLSVRAKGEA